MIHKGVVDSQLKIYDTTNVRVVDASIVPVQVRTQRSALIYQPHWMAWQRRQLTSLRPHIALMIMLNRYFYSQ